MAHIMDIYNLGFILLLLSAATTNSSDPVASSDIHVHTITLSPHLTKDVVCFESSTGPFLLHTFLYHHSGTTLSWLHHSKQSYSKSGQAFCHFLAVSDLACLLLTVWTGVYTLVWSLGLWALYCIRVLLNHGRNPWNPHLGQMLKENLSIFKNLIV